MSTQTQLEPMASTVPLVSLKQITKTYPGNPPLTVLNNVTLDIEVGEDVAVVGPSGSGKTTMLSIMGILDQPSSGEVFIDGLDPTDFPEAAKARLRAESIGFVFQQFFLLPTLSAWENVAEGMLYQGIKRATRRERAFEALEKVGLAPRASHRPGQLSGGEQQRVAIARAIAGGPRLLFADEPTGALDQSSGQLIVDQLQSIASDGTTVVVITHDQGLASRFSRQISLLDGNVVADTKSGEMPSVKGLKTSKKKPREVVEVRDPDFLEPPPIVVDQSEMEPTLDAKDRVRQRIARVRTQKKSSSESMKEPIKEVKL
jgi:putative ABC transport system ATP-binding protein